MREKEELRCAMNGEDLCVLDPRLRVQDIEENVRMAWKEAERPGGGRFFTGAPRRDTLEVTLTFMVKERDRGRRQQILQRVNGWAREGWLTVSTRPDQRLYVVCTQIAGGAQRAWNADAQLVFAACGNACWQGRYPVQASLQGSSGSVSIRPMGTRACCLEAEITNESASPVNALHLTVNGRQMAFENLALGQGETLRIFYDARHLLHAETGGTGRLDCRTGVSADDLLLRPLEENTVLFNADRVCSVTLEARGEYD